MMIIIIIIIIIMASCSALAQLASCPALAQNKYLARHNAVLKVLFWEMLRGLQLSDTVPPWYSPAVPKRVYKSPEAQAYWDIPVFAVSEQLKQISITQLVD